MSLRKLASILMLLAFLGLGTGALEYWHNLDQAHHETTHDQANCPTHAILRAPLLSASWAPLLCCIGLMLAVISLPSQSLISQHTPARTDCRGPPSR